MPFNFSHTNEHDLYVDDDSGTHSGLYTSIAERSMGSITFAVQMKNRTNEGRAYFIRHRRYHRDQGGALSFDGETVDLVEPVRTTGMEGVDVTIVAADASHLQVLVKGRAGEDIYVGFTPLTQRCFQWPESSVPEPTFADYFDRLILDPTIIEGANDGDPQSTLADTSGLGHDYTQTGSARLTYVASSASLGCPAWAANGTTQHAVCNDPVLGGDLAAFSVAVAMTFLDTSGTRSAICFGDNINNGFDLDINRNADGFLTIHLAGVVNITAGIPDTDPHLYQLTYNGAWVLEIDGVDQSLTFDTSDPVSPTTRSVIGATDTVPNFCAQAHYGPICAASYAHSADDRIAVRSIMKAKCPGLP